ncbi:MAG: DNA-3-methyladenine glycosylase [Vicinamibacterales bacterium]
MARRHLMRADPKLGAIIKKLGACELHAAGPRDPFETLTRSIASQQLSTKAADTIFGRFCDLFPKRKPVPAVVMTLTDDQIRATGFSRPKVGYIRDLAERVLDGRLDLKRLRKHSDEEVMQQLVAVKGIGRWTAEIFLMFRLGRPDVLPADDLGLMNAAHRVYGLRKRPTPDQLRKLGEPWRPYRSVAAWYLWASLEES